MALVEQNMQILNCVFLFQRDRFPDRFNIKDSSLSIRKTKRGDAGLYLLDAANDLGEKSKEIHLSVQYLPT